MKRFDREDKDAQEDEWKRFRLGGRLEKKEEKRI
jgi:hypothetical protein